MRPRRDNPAGLTLLETLLAISMLAVILVALHTALSSGVGAYRRCRDASERDTMAWGAIRLIGEDLQRLTCQSPTGGGQALWGASEVNGPGTCLLRMRTHARAAPGARDMLVDYFFVPGERGGALVRRSEPLERPGPDRQQSAAGDAAADQARYETIAAGLRAVRLRYFDGQAWSESYSSARRSWLPRLVEVTLEFDGGPGQASYVLALPVAVEGPALGPVEEARP